MLRLYRLCTALITVAILFTACGERPVAEDIPAPTGGAMPVAADRDARAATTDEDASDVDGNSACAAGKRLFDHEILATDPLCVPAEPQRVVAMDPASFEVMLLTGQQPVGAVSWLLSIYSNSYDYLIPETAGIVDVGFPPDLESIAALDPDLIVVGGTEEYDELSQIAPTVQYTQQGSGDWKRPMELAGDVLNQSEAVAARFAAYEARLATLADTVGNPTEIAVSIVRISPEQLMINLVNSYPSVIVADAGFSRPEAQALTVETAEELYESAIGGFISLEEIPRVDGDVVFVWSQQVTVEQNNAADAYYQAIQDEPVWQTLEAVQNNSVYRVGGHWIGWGFYAAHAVIDDLFTYVAEMDPAEVAPNPFIAGKQAAVGGSTLCANNQRLIASENILAPVCLPLSPQRIVTLDPFYSLQNSIQLGLPVIASATGDGGASFPEALTTEETAGIEPIGQFDAPNLETIAALNPDLIIGDAFFHEERVDLLNAIAPTVLITTPDWKQWIHTIAEAAGNPNRAAEGFEEYNVRITEIEPRLRDIEVSFVRLLPGGEFQVYLDGPSAYAPFSVLAEAGVRRTAFETTDTDTVLIRPDFEGIPNLTGDVLLYTVGGVNDVVEGDDLVNEVTSNPIWQQLPAVQAGEAYRVNTAHWMGFGGLRSANAILDDVEAYLTIEE
ncbi:MAG: iron-siderophore ABC transporter substrate-binding protein [Chloroflexales bacterium]|nr:iron-siderophore ABC transporter substrate-binding protein [Chloroflexales bacterium]